MRKRLVVLWLMALVLFPPLVWAVSVDLAWSYTVGNAVPSEFRLYRQLGGQGDFRLQGHVTYPGERFTDVGVSWNGLYCYKVTAYDLASSEESSPSNVVSVVCRRNKGL